jgi:hypothetical protein
MQSSDFSESSAECDSSGWKCRLEAAQQQLGHLLEVGDDFRDEDSDWHSTGYFCAATNSKE